MSRLIDADELKKQLEHGVWNDIIKEIDDTPTAYDVDKVVERLEEERLTSHTARSEFITGMNMISANMCVGEINAYTKAIEIVKAGGLNEQTEA